MLLNMMQLINMWPRPPFCRSGHPRCRPAVPTPLQGTTRWVILRHGSWRENFQVNQVQLLHPVYTVFFTNFKFTNIISSCWSWNFQVDKMLIFLFLFQCCNDRGRWRWQCAAEGRIRRGGGGILKARPPSCWPPRTFLPCALPVYGAQTFCSARGQYIDFVMGLFFKWQNWVLTRHPKALRAITRAICWTYWHAHWQLSGHLP